MTPKVKKKEPKRPFRFDLTRTQVGIQLPILKKLVFQFRLFDSKSVSPARICGSLLCPITFLTHKYLDLKINLSKLLQILCETYAPP
ncbi:hypothetical protein FFZ95_11675 [Leptospira borgpetersenii]|nr:hypothetical protein FFZ95_11675 [Leptospira borgpetersenii]